MVNAAFAALFGYDDPAELEAVDAIDLYAKPSDRSRMVEGVVGGALAGSMEIEMQRRDGSRFWAQLTSSVHRAPDGTPLELEGVVVDVTGRRRAEEALRSSEARFRTAFDDAGVGQGRTIARRNDRGQLYGWRIRHPDSLRRGE